MMIHKDDRVVCVWAVAVLVIGSLFSYIKGI